MIGFGNEYVFYITKLVITKLTPISTMYIDHLICLWLQLIMSIEINMQLAKFANRVKLQEQ